MRTVILLALIPAICLYTATLPAASEGSGGSQKTKLNTMLKDIMEKSKSIKPAKYEVTLPVATAGARGAETRQADKFAVIWPDPGISPLTALAENMRCAAERGVKTESLRSQLEDFKKTFPEYINEKLLKDLADIIQKTK
ncbi:MAG: hypothetical protein PHR77_01725 [Kiritimatiellae bacterium]|nr:hypothetical protein [Kiritimatiellia bacterium]MDD5522460.1 hypothetical protein [Kiritimatiellia bacterium]